MGLGYGEILLPLFPHGSLDSSVTTTVFVGIAVAVFFNLRFGWVLSGLVVPGYLVPLLIIQPWSAAVVVIESLVTYFLVLWTFKYFSRTGIWTTVFGRDRFFALLLGSVIVRIVFDCWLLPLAGEAINTSFGIHFDYRNHLHSFGLIIIALMANQFWKPGFFRGAVPLVVTVGITYFFVRYGLMEYTNFTISNLGYLYEDIAASMLASPKAYIILLTTAFVASHMNLQYGWEYSGILIPSLLALMWYQPAKIVASIVEAVVILFMAVLVLQLPLFQRATIEGGRKILLFFGISYLYKFMLAYLILAFWPELKITDFYGFGYLLPSLLAIKMYDKDMLAVMVRTTLQTSLTALILASIIGFSLTAIPSVWSVQSALPGTSTDVAIVQVDRPLIDLVREDKVSLYKSLQSDYGKNPFPMEIEIFSEAVRKLMRYGETGEQSVLLHAQWLLEKIDYQVLDVQDRYLYLRDRLPERGWGLYVIDRQSSGRLLVEVPHALGELHILDAGTWLFITMEGKAFSAGGAVSGSLQSSENVLVNYNSFFHAFHRTVARRDVVQLRGYTVQNLRALYGVRITTADIDIPEMESTLWVKGAFPPGLHLGKLRELIGDFSIEWTDNPLNNIQRDGTATGFAELFLNRQDVRKFFFKPLMVDYEVPLEVRDQRIDGYLQDWLLTGKAKIAVKGSEGYVAPQLEELLFVDEEVLTPLLKAIDREYRSSGWTQEGLDELQSISVAANMMGYAIIRYHHKVSGQDYVILMEESNPDESMRHWGTYVFRCGTGNNYLIQIPRPLSELRVFEYGVSLFERLQASALLISGAHKLANLDGSADIMRLENKANLFNLVSQVFMREAGAEPVMVVQTRALGVRRNKPDPDCDAVVSFYDGSRAVEGLDVFGTVLIDTLKRDNVSVRFADGSESTAGYEAVSTPQALYLDQTVNKEFALLWLSPQTRMSYRQQTENRWEEVEFQALNIPAKIGYLHQYVTDVSVTEASENLEGLRNDIRHYVDDNDIMSLMTVVETWSQYRFQRFVDLNTRQAFLMVYTRRKALVLVANLEPRSFEAVYYEEDDGNKDHRVGEFIETRSAWLMCK